MLVPEQQNHAQEQFNTFDVMKRGWLVLEEVSVILTRQGLEYSEGQIQELIAAGVHPTEPFPQKGSDTSKTLKVTFHNFIRLLGSQYAASDQQLLEYLDYDKDGKLGVQDQERHMDTETAMYILNHMGDGAYISYEKFFLYTQQGPH